MTIGFQRNSSKSSDQSTKDNNEDEESENEEYTVSYFWSSEFWPASAIRYFKNNSFLDFIQGSVSFLGNTIQSKNGLRLFRASVIVLPLIPMLILIIQSVFTVDDLVQKGENLTKFENQVFFNLF